MMKAAVVTSYTGPLEIKQVPIPQPGPNDVLVKLIACGVCHSDLAIAKEGKIKVIISMYSNFSCLFFIESSPIPLPRIVGHEGIGEIVELGQHVSEYLQKGDLVGIPFIQKTCLHCEFCLSARETLCENQRLMSICASGCFAEYVLIDANFAIKLPEGMDPFTSAPLFCAGVTVYKALKVSKARPGQWISIIGIGGLGQFSGSLHCLRNKVI